MSVPRPSHSESRGPRPGPVVLLVPLLALILGVLWARHGLRAPRGPRPAPPPAANGEVDAWEGGAVLPGGGRLEARLVPLHADPGRAAFDAERLRVLLGRPDDGAGRPWRLELVQHGGPPSVGDLAALALRDAGGGRLVPAAEPTGAAGSTGGQGAPTAPLLPLLAPPRGSLAAGQGVSLVLWGSPADGPLDLEGAAVPLELAPLRLPLEVVYAGLARVDAEREAAR